jgi:hypothetical protein
METNKLFDFIVVSELSDLERSLKDGTINPALLDADFFTEHCSDDEWFVNNQNTLLLLLLAGLSALKDQDEKRDFVYHFLYSYSMDRSFEPTIKALLDESGIKLDTEIVSEIGEHYLDPCRDGHINIEFFTPFTEDNALDTIKEIVEEKRIRERELNARARERLGR